MKHVTLLSILSLSLFFLTSCEKEKESSVRTVWDTYVVNYGSFSGSKSTMSGYDDETKEIGHNIYEHTNGLEIGSNVQSASTYNGKTYFMSNDGDKIDIVNDSTLEANVSPISSNITKPRYFAAQNNTAYISCFGEVDDWAVMENSYIAKVDLEARTVSNKIAIPGGPEGVIIKNNKLYSGLTAKNQVAVINLDNDEVSYIDVPALPKQLVEDSHGNIWASLVSEFSVSFDSTKLGVIMIDPETDETSNFTNIQGIGSNGYLASSPDQNTLYVMGNESYPGTTSFITAIDLSTNTLASDPLIEGENFYGFGCNPETGDIYVLISPGTDVNGSMEVYDAEGTLLDEQQTGIAPQHVVFN